MNELNEAQKLRIQLPTAEEKLLSAFLPDAFGPSDLAIKQRLLTAQHNLPCELNVPDNPLLSAAITAANLSYAPYGKNLSGVALRCHSGEIFTGQLAENAAFNPSLPPLQVALNLLNLHGKHYTDISDAVHVEKLTTTVSYAAQTRSLLHAVAPNVRLQYYSC